MGRLEGKVALITGTGSGQGREAALRFTAEGAKVVGCDVNEEGQAQTKQMVRAAGGEMKGWAPVDLGDAAACKAWVDRAAGVHGRVDILYNNASRARFGSIADISIEDWHYTTRNELDLVFFTTKFAWPHLVKSNGLILNIASIAGQMGDRDTPIGPHAATKAAVVALTKQMAVEGEKHCMRAVSISPGFIDTMGVTQASSDDAFVSRLIAKNLVGRAGTPKDVVALAVFLASDEAAFITGADFVIDGGMRAHG